MLRTKLLITKANIVSMQVDAIVNAANTSLLGGGGVDGAIHRAAGPELLNECRALGGCETGEAKITSGYRLPARWVIHTVGPVWRDTASPEATLGSLPEDKLLARCYQSSFELVVRHSIRTIAFPSISTGAYRFPIRRAAQLALKEIGNAFQLDLAIERVTIVCFDPQTLHAYEEALLAILVKL